jgi:hypothetical protein
MTPSTKTISITILKNAIKVICFSLKTISSKEDDEEFLKMRQEWSMNLFMMMFDATIWELRMYMLISLTLTHTTR